MISAVIIRLKINSCGIMLNMMKYFKLSILFVLTGLLLYGCNSPAPTELVSDTQSQNPVQVEVITKDTGNVYYNNGFDTTGIAEPNLNYSNIITVTGTKLTEDGNTTQSGYAQILFFDTLNPIKSPSGKVLGYLMRKINFDKMNVMFDNFRAVPVPYRLRYKQDGQNIDTLLGEQYVLVNRGNMTGRFKFRYNSKINFKMLYDNKPVNLSISTPSEITGTVNMTGHLSEKNLNAVVQWNGEGGGGIELIIGAIAKNSNSPFPLYKLQLQDKGSISIPPKLLNEIPQNKYGKFVFTLVRKIVVQRTGGNANLYVLSQSIHSIILDIP